MNALHPVRERLGTMIPYALESNKMHPTARRFMQCTSHENAAGRNEDQERPSKFGEA